MVRFSGAMGAAIAFALCAPFLIQIAYAQDAPPQAWDYFVSMRSLTEDTAPHYVSAVAQAGGQYTSPFQGCDDNTYYLTAGDAQVVSDALAGQDTVQLHSARQGTGFASSGIVCVVQAGQ